MTAPDWGGNPFEVLGPGPCVFIGWRLMEVQSHGQEQSLTGARKSVLDQVAGGELTVVQGIAALDLLVVVL